MTPFVLETVSGKFLDPSNIDPEMIDIQDIAWSLSRISRFAGHTITAVPYNVAQHCVFVSEMIEAATNSKLAAFAGLLHDAAECYIGDIPSPIKHLPELKAVIDPIEDAILDEVYMKFIPHTKEASPQAWSDIMGRVKYFDKRAQFIEAHAFMSSRGLGWVGREKHEISLPDLQNFPAPMDSISAFKLFINRFNELECSCNYR